VSDDIKRAMEGMLIPDKKEVQLGRAVVQETFSISRFGTIAGCRVIQGTIERSAQMRIIRDGTVVGTYPIESLKRHKDDAREVRDGMECGIKIAHFDDVKKGDVLEAFKIEEVKRTF
jgi:translation initiation factor IF-2